MPDFNYHGEGFVVRGQCLIFLPGDFRLQPQCLGPTDSWFLTGTAADLPRWAMLLADAEGDLLARQAHHAHFSAVALDELAESKEGKRLPEHRLKAKLRANPEHYKREIEIAEAHRSVVFLRAVVQLLTQRSQ